MHRNSQENTCARTSFLMKAYSFIKEELWHRLFPVNFAQVLEQLFSNLPRSNCFWAAYQTAKSFTSSFDMYHASCSMGRFFIFTESIIIFPKPCRSLTSLSYPANVSTWGQRCFNVNLTLPDVTTSYQPKNNIEIFAG